MKGIWFIIAIIVIFITYAYFGFGDERAYNGASIIGNQATSTSKFNNQ